MTVIQSSAIRFSNSFLGRHFTLPTLRAFYGVFIALCIPIGWIFVQWLAGRNPFSTQHFDPLLYAYIGLAATLFCGSIGYSIGKREQAMTDLALSDSLTSLYNKRYFQTRLDQEFERFQRYKTPMSLIQIDLDHFKHVNDTWGHQAGDMVLRKVAKAVLENLRTGEIAARVGGEEICIIVCNSSSQSAFQLAERLRTSIQNLQLNWHGEAIKISASFGIAEAEKNTLTKWQLYEHADKALYKAKKHGRNLTYIYDYRDTQAA